MTPVLWLQAFAMLILLAASAFFSSAETALFSLNPIHIHRIRRKRPAAARRIARLLEHPPRLLSTILIGNTLVNVGASSMAFVIAERLVPMRGETIAIPVMTLLLLVTGEVAPKRMAMRRGEAMAVLYAPVLLVFMRLTTPLRVLLEGIAARFRDTLAPKGRTLSEAEFQTMVEIGSEEGVIDEEERAMVDGIIRLEETQAKDVMTPRVDLIGIDLDAPVEVSERIARSVRFRYLPVYRESLDHAEGFLDVPRFLLSESGVIGDAIIPPFFVPETVPLDTLLSMFQREKKRVAIVSDEYGGTAGLVTRGDVLEEIVDSATNEYGHDTPEIHSLGDQRWLAMGSASLEAVNYELNLNLEAEGADRIAGWISAHLERMPRTNDVVEAQSCRATVQRIRKRRILTVLLERTADKTHQDEEHVA